MCACAMPAAGKVRRARKMAGGNGGSSGSGGGSGSRGGDSFSLDPLLSSASLVRLLGGEGAST